MIIVTPLSCEADTYCNETGVSPHGSESSVRCGWTGGNGFRNPLFRFDISGLTGRIQSAILRLFLTTATTEPGSRDGLFGLLKNIPWVETTADWDEYDTSLFWTGAGLDPDDDFVDYPSLAFTLPQTSLTAYEYDVTSLVQLAKEQGFGTATIAVYNQDGGMAQQTDCQFGSRTTFVEARRPLLTVTTKSGGSPVGRFMHGNNLP